MMSVTALPLNSIEQFILSRQNRKSENFYLLSSRSKLGLRASLNESRLKCDQVNWIVSYIFVH
ncbi:unnamed protein product [Heterobilharzia americana]|nr:unnamed protein product [Heterobilharzia americana]